MKKLILLIGLAFLTLSACNEDSKPDPCQDVNCLNGGLCIDGSCDCLPPYTGARCEIDTSTADPCDGVECFNGGTCVNGQCDCPKQWTGPSCLEQVAPDKLLVTKIEVLAFPPTDNGAGWDLSSGADIYIEIWDAQDNVLYKHNNYYPNANPNGVYAFDVDPDLEVTRADLSDRFSVMLWDYDDTSADDFMSGIENSVYSSGNNFPDSEEWDAGAGFKVRVHYTYIHN